MSSVTWPKKQLIDDGIGLSVDAFARMRVSNPTTVFDSQLQYDKQPLLWDEWGTGTSTHNANESTVTMSVTSGQSLYRQTWAYHRYQPGKSQLVILTARCGSCTNVRIVKRSKVSGVVVDTSVDIGDWSESNPSDYDFESSTIFWMDIEWLGVGSVTTGIFRNRQPVPLHQFHHAGLIDSTYMTTANLPLRYAIVSDGASVKKQYGYFDDDNGIFLEVEDTSSASGSMKHICSTVISEGGQSHENAYYFAAQSPSGTPITVSSTEIPLLAIRPKSTFNSVVNRGMIRPGHFHIGVLTNDIVFRVYYNATVTGGSWTSANANSITDYNVTATSFSGGIMLDVDYVLGGKQSGQSFSSDEASKYPLTLDHAGANPKTFLVTGQRIGNSDATVVASMQWEEVR
jgi:hypothetical protein